MNIFLETCEDKFKIQCAKMTPEYQAASIVIVSSPVLLKYLSDCIILSKKSSEKWQKWLLWAEEDPCFQRVPFTICALLEVTKDLVEISRWYTSDGQCFQKQVSNIFLSSSTPHMSAEPIKLKKVNQDSSPGTQIETTLISSADI